MRALKRCNTLTKAIQSGTPSLGSLIRLLSEKQIEAYIKLWLIDLNETLDLKKPLQEHQIDTIAFYIVDKYRSLNIADLNLIFSNAKSGEYSGVYDRITTPTVMKWFKEYFEARCQAAAEQSYVKHISSKERNNKPSAPSNHLLSKVKGVFSAARLAAEKNNEEINKVKK